MRNQNNTVKILDNPLIFLLFLSNIREEKEDEEE